MTAGSNEYKPVAADDSFKSAVIIFVVTLHLLAGETMTQEEKAK
jgi:hypothetical protein